MKYALLLFIFPNVFCYLYKLREVDTKCDVDELPNINKNGFTKYFAIPIGDPEADFKSYEIVDGSDKRNPVPLTYSTKAQVSESTMLSTHSPQICYSDVKHDLKGVLYFVEEVFGDMDVYHFFDGNYSVSAVKKYTTIFAKTSGGSTLRNIQTETSFEIYSGLPGDNENLLYTYDTQWALADIFITEDHFFILNTGGKTLNFTVTDGGDSPKTIIFDTNGFIMTPGFPNLPDADYLDLDINLKPRTNDKIVKIKITAVKAKDETNGMEQNIQLLDTDSKVEVIVGSGNCEFPVTELKTFDCSQSLPKTLDKLQIKATNAAYTLQFESEEEQTTATPTSTQQPASTAEPTTTTTKLTAGTATSAPACPTQLPCPTVTPITSCPTVPVCSCSISTTEVPSTTMGASTVILTSMMTYLSVYYVL